MYFGIGFFLAALSVLIVAPLVHDRAVRLTMRRLEATIPLSMAELQEGDARRHCAGGGKGRVDGALGRSINSRDQQWAHFHAVACSSGSSHYSRVQSIALVGVEVAHYSERGAQANPFMRALL
jgi:hypothetical protein